MITQPIVDETVMTRMMTTSGVFSVGILEDITQFYAPLIPLFVMAMALVITDARFGVLLSKKNGLVVRFSRLVRRSINKFLDYFCWVTIAGLLGHVYGTPLHWPNFEIIAMAGIYGLELNSIVNNYLELKDINLRVNFMKWFTKKTGTTDLIEKYGGNKRSPKRNKSLFGNSKS